MKSVMRYLSMMTLIVTASLINASSVKDFKYLQRQLTSQHNLLFGKRNVWRYLIPSSDRANFNSYLADVQSFIGKDNAQRKQDFVSIEKIWKNTISAVQLAFDYIRRSRKTSASSEKIKWSELHAEKIDIAKVKGYFTKVFTQMDEVDRISKNAKAGEQECYGKACKERFQILNLHAQFLLTTLQAIQKSLDRLENFVANGNIDAQDKE